MFRLRHLSCILILTAFRLQLPGQENNEIPAVSDVCKFGIMFYNLENYFDTRDDSLTGDEEFTPSGSRAWDNYRFYTKRNHLFKVILAAGNGNPPVLIGMCEAENRFVLERLAYDSPLQLYGYGIVHYDSPDPRGIDVALLFRKELFRLLHTRPVHISFPEEPSVRTRDVLYVKGILDRQDTLHIMVCHWPSKYGGVMATQARRKHLARMVRSLSDSVMTVEPSTSLVIMGDLNDEPGEESVQYLTTPIAGATAPPLVNLMESPCGCEGTHKYQGIWSILDQILVSKNLTDQGGILHVSPGGARIFCPPFLLSEDERHLGNKPFGTYSGPVYRGGFSDHLPVLVDIIRKP